MSDHLWVQSFPGAITVADAAGIIIEMNDAARESFRDQGGEKLLGTSLLDCHPEPSRTRLVGIMANQRTNVYTFEKHGQKRLIYQTPWYRDGKYAGFVELSLEIPWEMAHFVRT
jgi:transcriptional regulator with PAS, ATPase and Fis domain